MFETPAHLEATGVATALHKIVHGNRQVVTVVVGIHGVTKAAHVVQESAEGRVGLEGVHVRFRGPNPVGHLDGHRGVCGLVEITGFPELEAETGIVREDGAEGVQGHVGCASSFHEH